MGDILIIDDDRDVRQALRAAVEMAGHTVSTASNGLDGLKKLREHAFDVVVTDLVMPDMEGIETIQALKKQHPGVRIIAVSGGGQYADGTTYLSMARSLGADETMSKPLSVWDLNDRIAALLTPSAGADRES